MTLVLLGDVDSDELGDDEQTRGIVKNNCIRGKEIDPLYQENSCLKITQDTKHVTTLITHCFYPDVNHKLASKLL